MRYNNYKEIAIAILLFFIFLFISCTDSSNTNTKKDKVKAQLNFDRGYSWYVKGDFDQAIVAYSYAISYDPNFVSAYNNRGLAWLNRGDPEKAYEDFKKALKLNKDDMDVWYNLGLACSDLKKYEKAIYYFSQVIENEPLYIEAYYNRAIAQKNKGNFPEAIIDFSKVIEIDPQFADAYEKLTEVVILEEKKIKTQGQNQNKIKIKEIEHVASERDKLSTKEPKNKAAKKDKPVKKDNLAVKKSKVKPSVNKKVDDIKTEKWLLSQDPNMFTIQLLAVQNKKNLIDFIVENNLKDYGAYIKANKKGKTWYILFYGIYDSEKQAKNKIRSLLKKIDISFPIVIKLSFVFDTMKSSKLKAQKTPTQKTDLSLKEKICSNNILYTVQLLSANGKNKLNKFLRNYKKNNKFAYFKTKNKNWYVLFYGVYLSKQKANDAINKLPSSLQKLSPISRKLPDITNCTNRWKIY